MPAPLMSFQDARRTVEHQAATVSPPGTETLSLLQSAQRILAEPIFADRDIPPFPRSTRDGYAVRSADLKILPAKLKLIGEIKAGPTPTLSHVSPGETFSIMTGACVPPGADAVVMVEYSSQQNNSVEITQQIAPGDNIVPQGAEAKRSTLLLAPGTLLDESAIALAASVGKSRLQVFLRPRIAILTTGDEIVDLEAEISPTQIRNSNSYSLAVQILRAGGEPLVLPTAPDESCRLRELILQGIQADILILTGGVSMGRYDLVEQVLAQLQAEFFFTGAKIQPGRPVVFGRVNSRSLGARPLEGASELPSPKYFLGLPGNPVSTMVTFELFARPMIEALAGMSPRPLTFLHARLKSEIRVKPGLTRFLPAFLSGDFENSYVELISWHGSGDIAARSRANCYIVTPSDREHIAAGEWVAIMLH